MSNNVFLEGHRNNFATGRIALPSLPESTPLLGLLSNIDGSLTWRGPIRLHPIATPSIIVDHLYNLNGSLIWNGANIGTEQTLDEITPTTTKGDLITENSSNVVRLGIGNNTTILTADSNAILGITWASTLANISKIGVGINLPDEFLSIRSSGSSINSYLDLGDTTNQRLKIGYTGVSNESPESNQLEAQILVNTGGDLILSSKTNGTSDIILSTTTGTTTKEVIRVKNNGSVGIGTNNPINSLLHISSVNGDTVLRLESDTDNDNENDNVRIEMYQDSAIVFTKMGLQGDIPPITNGISNFFFLDSTHGAQFAFGGAALVTMTSGNVGIGTNVPVSRLHVISASSFSCLTLASTLPNSASLLKLDGALGSKAANMVLNRATAGGGDFESLIKFSTDDNIKWEMGLENTLNATQSNEDFIIQSINGQNPPRFHIERTTGHVGINTTHPEQFLHVQGGGYFSGNVGIGDINPDEKLEINGGAIHINSFVPTITSNRLYNSSGSLFWSGSSISTIEGLVVGITVKGGLLVGNDTNAVVFPIGSNAEVLTIDSTSSTGVTWSINSAVGENNTASNIGVTGFGIFKQKSGINFEFKKLTSSSNKLVIIDDISNNEIDIDVNVNINDITPGVTKGDLILEDSSGNGVRLPVGSNTSYLFADSTTSTGVTWAAAVTLNALTPGVTKGDLIVENGSADVVRLGVGNNGNTLVVDSNISTGITWGSYNHSNLTNKGSNTHAQIDTHISNTNNPHSVNIDQVAPGVTKGGLIVGNGSNAVNFAVGGNGNILIADSNVSNGITWGNTLSGDLNIDGNLDIGLGITTLFQVDSTTGKVGIGVTANSSTNAQLHIKQSDDNDAMVNFEATSSSDATKPISTNIGGTEAGKIKININGGEYWIKFFNFA